MNATMEADPTKAYNQDDATGFIHRIGIAGPAEKIYRALTTAEVDDRCDILNPNGIPSFSPGLRGTSYPGFTSHKNHQL